MQTQEIAIKRNIAPETQIKLMSQLEQSNIARYSNVESLETSKTKQCTLHSANCLENYPHNIGLLVLFAIKHILITLSNGCSFTETKLK